MIIFFFYNNKQGSFKTIDAIAGTTIAKAEIPAASFVVAIGSAANNGAPIKAPKWPPHMKRPRAVHLIR